MLASDIHGMTTIETDAELLRRSASEPAAFGELYRRHGVALRRHVVSRVGIGSGEDLAAEVFVRAFRTREKCRAEHDSVRPWLFGVANHVISDHRRLERRRLATLERLLVEERDLAGNPDVGLTPETFLRCAASQQRKETRSCSSYGESFRGTRSQPPSECLSAPSNRCGGLPGRRDV